jgi:hypothetical protein
LSQNIGTKYLLVQHFIPEKLITPVKRMAVRGRFFTAKVCMTVECL